MHFAAITQAMAGFGATADDPRRPAGEHHEHSGFRNQPGDVLPICEWVAEAPKGRASSASAGSAEGGCVALLQASTCAARPWVSP